MYRRLSGHSQAVGCNIDHGEAVSGLLQCAEAISGVGRRLRAKVTASSMSTLPETEPVFDAEERFERFDRLMPFRVQDVLLVSNLYDSFIMREDGRLNELLIGESREMNLQQIPGIT